MGGCIRRASCHGVRVVCSFMLAFGVIFGCAVTVPRAACGGEESCAGPGEYNDGVEDVHPPITFASTHVR
jgi:hypothetical protein